MEDGTRVPVDMVGAFPDGLPNHTVGVPIDKNFPFPKFSFGDSIIEFLNKICEATVIRGANCWTMLRFLQSLIGFDKSVKNAVTDARDDPATAIHFVPVDQSAPRESIERKTVQLCQLLCHIYRERDPYAANAREIRSLKIATRGPNFILIDYFRDLHSVFKRHQPESADKFAINRFNELISLSYPEWHTLIRKEVDYLKKYSPELSDIERLREVLEDNIFTKPAKVEVKA